MRGVAAPGAIRAWSQRAAKRRPAAPVKPTTVMPQACAACTAFSTLAERPLVVMATSTSPGAPRPSSWRANTASYP
jgi:hypothetical protein